MRRGFSYTNGFDSYGLLDSGSMFMAFCRDIQTQFQATKERLNGQDLDEYMVAVGGGYYFCPPGVSGDGDYLGRRLVAS
jgi:deferrochelatase/peroxidase EfeB